MSTTGTRVSGTVVPGECYRVSAANAAGAEGEKTAPVCVQPNEDDAVTRWHVGGDMAHCLDIYINPHTGETSAVNTCSETIDVEAACPDELIATYDELFQQEVYLQDSEKCSDRTQGRECRRLVGDGWHLDHDHAIDPRSSPHCTAQYTSSCFGSREVVRYGRCPQGERPHIVACRDYGNPAFLSPDGRETICRHIDDGLDWPLN